MADVEYQPDSKGIGELARSPLVHAMLAEVAEDAIPFAQSISPDATPYGTGYIDAFEVDSGHVELVARFRRAVAHLVNNADHAAAVEFGNPNIQAHHVLSRTADYIEAQS